MFRHLIKIAIRNFLRYKSFAFINIFGLSFGLTTFILIALFVQYEFSWDKLNKDYDRIFHILAIAHMADGDDTGVRSVILLEMPSKMCTRK